VVITDPLLAGEFVSDIFGWSAPLAMTLAGEGHMGRIWRLETRDGAYAVKELHWARDAAAEERAVARQVAFCDAARSGGTAGLCCWIGMTHVRRRRAEPSDR